MATAIISAVPPLQQLDVKQQGAMRNLVLTVVRSFYEPRHYILVELLLKHNILRDDDLAGRVGLNVKDLNRIMATLTSHRIVQAYRQNEMKENQGRIVGKAYFWIDLHKFCNVIKWRISDMRNKIDNSLKSELDNKGYICPRCTKQYTALEVDQVYDFVRNGLYCDVCDTELVDNENSEKVKGSKDRMQRFNAQMKWIRDGLRNIEGVVMPAFDVARYVREKMAAQRAAGQFDEDGLKIAQGGGQVQQVEIQMASDEDDDERKKERQKAAEEKRKQNALPTWHTTSTISGDKTALGVLDDVRKEGEAAQAQFDAKTREAEHKAKSFDTNDTEDYYEKLISGDSSKKRKNTDDMTDPRFAKIPRREGDPSVPGWPGYPGMPPMQYGYPPGPGFYMPGYGFPGPMPLPTPGASKPRSVGTPSTQQSQASGTSHHPSPRPSDSDSSENLSTAGVSSGGARNGNGASPIVGPGGLAKKKKPSLNGLEKRVSFAEEVRERSASVRGTPEPTSGPPSGVEEKKKSGEEEYNPWVKVGGKDVRARDVKEGDDELMTADEYEIYWEIKEKIDELDGVA